MRFDVLGPLQVNGPDGPVLVKGYKGQLLLSMFLASANHPIASDTLLDVLWQGKLTAESNNRLRWHIHQLRRTLDTSERLGRDHSGYTFFVKDGELDAQRFSAQAAVGADALSGGDLTTAATAYREAIAIWRGSPYTGFLHVDSLREAADRLNRHRVDVLHGHFAVELELGNHESLLPELTTALGQHRLDEQFRVQLMLALYRCGRQADALELFQQGRQVLTSELGIEPGRALREMERAILTKDPVIDPPAVNRAVATTSPSPAELPSAAQTLSGRATQLSTLSAAFSSREGTGTATVLVNGIGGIGKSALAISLAHELAADFPDGQLYVDLRGDRPTDTQLSPARVLHRFLRSLHAAAPAEMLDTAELSKRFRSVTVDKRLLVVLDAAHDSAQVRPLLPSQVNCGVIITARRNLASLPGVKRCALSGLSETESRQMLAKLVGSRRIAQEPEAAQQLVAACDGLPLALAICAARLRKRRMWSLEQLALLLADPKQRLDELQTDDRSVRDEFSTAYREICEEPHAKLFRMLGVHQDSTVTVDQAAALLDEDSDSALRQLEALVDVALVESAGLHHYRIHELLKLYAREQSEICDTDDERASAAAAVARLGPAG